MLILGGNLLLSGCSSNHAVKVQAIVIDSKTGEQFHDCLVIACTKEYAEIWPTGSVMAPETSPSVTLIGVELKRLHDELCQGQLKSTKEPCPGGTMVKKEQISHLFVRAGYTPEAVMEEDVILSAKHGRPIRVEMKSYDPTDAAFAAGVVTFSRIVIEEWLPVMKAEEVDRNELIGILEKDLTRVRDAGNSRDEAEALLKKLHEQSKK